MRLIAQEWQQLNAKQKEVESSRLNFQAWNVAFTNAKARYAEELAKYKKTPATKQPVAPKPQAAVVTKPALEPQPELDPNPALEPELELEPEPEPEAASPSPLLPPPEEAPVPEVDQASLSDEDVNLQAALNSVRQKFAKKKVDPKAPACQPL